MTTKLILVIVLITTGFGWIQNESQTYQAFFSYQDGKPRIEMKEIKATFNGEFLPAFKGSVVIEELQDVSAEEKQMRTNRLKREIGSEAVSTGDLAELNNSSAEDSEEIQTQNDQVVKTSAQDTPNEPDKIKRQTTIKGNGNRLSNLINLPLRLNVLANVLSQLNQGVIDVKDKPIGSNSINGNDNIVSSLVNAPLDAEAIVNVLSKVDRLRPGSEETGSGDGVVGGLLGGLLGGGSEKGLLGGLLGGVLGDGDSSGVLGGILGDTLADLLKGLLGDDSLVGNLLGGVNGKDLVTELLGNLLGGVVDLVDNLLDLLVGILEALSQSLADSNIGASAPAASGSSNNAGLNIQGNNNRVSSLINAPVRVNALINALSSLKQELRQAEPAGTNIQGNNNEISSLINLNTDLNVNANLLSSVVKEASSQPGIGKAGVPISTLLGPKSPISGLLDTKESFQTGAGNTNIEGNDNVLSSLLNVVPEVNLNLNLLSEITDLLGETSDNKVGNEAPSSRIQQGSNPNEICFDIPINQADTSITGDNNKISNAVNIKPKIHIDLNLLSNVKQTDVPTQRVCIIKPTKPPALPTRSPTSTSTTRKPALGIPASPPPQLPIPVPSMPVSRLPAQHAPQMTSSPNEICFDVLVDQSGTVVSGNNNQISSLVNIDPKINVGLNLLSNVQQASPHSSFKTKRICIPGQEKPTLGPKLVPTEPSSKPPANARCFKRICTRWRQFVDYNCLNEPKEYPKITYTVDT